MVRRDESASQTPSESIDDPPELVNLSKYLSTSFIKDDTTVDKIVGKFILMDGGDSGEFPREATIDIWEEFNSTPHRLKALLIVVLSGVVFLQLITWNNILALYIEFSSLLVQLAYAIDKFPGLRLDAKSYLSGAFIAATLEETKQVGPSILHPRRRTHYVVVFTSRKEDGSAITIRKTLKPSIFDRELHDGEVFETRFITELVSREGMPFSAFPQKSVYRHIKRQVRWFLYFMPILVSTCLAIVLSLIIYRLEYSSYGFDRARQAKLITSVFIVFGILYPLILIPIAFGVRNWLDDVTNGGEEISVA